MTCGLGGLVALSVMVRVPVRVPVAAGEKVTLMLQLAPAATLPPQLSDSEKSEAFVPPTTSDEIVSATFPVLLSTSAVAVLVVPTV